jgi:basic amino acid/polyamine antiporter, APA family
MTMAGPRVTARIADDDYLPRVLAGALGRPPRAALALQVVLSLALLWTAAYESRLTYIGFAPGLSTAVTVIGLLRLRRREGPAVVPVWGWPWVPVLFLIFVLGATGLTIVQRPVPSAAVAATLLGGLAAFRWRRRKSP